MIIEEVEELEATLAEFKEHGDMKHVQDIADQAIEALRAEAWYPIEKAERIHEVELLGCQRSSRIWEKMYWSDDKEAFIDSVTGCRTHYSHFKRITPPGN
jgi:hypothetical protein